jgi:hypothetical protein
MMREDTGHDLNLLTSQSNPAKIEVTPIFQILLPSVSAGKLARN